MNNRRIVVGFSGGVTSTWCAGWALRNFPKDEVIFLFHDTKEEDSDTYRFLRESAAALDHLITERSDGRTLTGMILDEGMIPNDKAAFCSRIMKAEPGERYIQELKSKGVTEIIKLYGFSAMEPDRVQRHTAIGWQQGFTARFPMIETGTTKQQAADWCQCVLGVPLPSMYAWSEHANCPGCFRGGKAYWLAVAEHRPEVYAKRAELEESMGHTISGRYSLVQILQEGLKRKVPRGKEAIDIGPCECGS